MICTKWTPDISYRLLAIIIGCFSPTGLRQPFCVSPSKHEDSLLSKKNAFPSTLCFVRHQRINIHNTSLRADPRRASQIYIASPLVCSPRPLCKFVQNTISLDVPMQLYCKRTSRSFLFIPFQAAQQSHRTRTFI